MALIALIAAAEAMLYLRLPVQTGPIAEAAGADGQQPGLGPCATACR